MRQIKFRGKRVDNGEFVFGDVAHTEVGILMGYGFEVAPDSVAQFVGCDLDGNEVYEGDEVVGKSGTTWVAVLNATVTLPEFANRSREPLKVNGFKLKEAHHDSQHQIPRWDNRSR